MFRARDKRVVANRLKVQAPLHHIPLIISDLCSVPALRISLVRNAKPKSFADIVDLHPLAQVSLDRELTWCISIFISIYEEFRPFLDLEADYNNASLTRDSDKAIKCLDLIRGEFGYSYWLVNAYLYTYEQAGLHEKRADFTKEILREKSKGFSAYVSYHMSRRADRGTNPTDYISSVRSGIADSDISDQLKEYLGFILLPIDSGMSFDPANILSYDEVSPLVDRYFSLIASLHRACEDGYFAERPNFFSMVDGLWQLLQDDRLLAVRDHIRPTSETVEDDPAAIKALEGVDAYTSGRYADSARILNDLVHINPTEVTLWEVLAKALARTGETPNPNLPTPVRDMTTAYLRQDGYEDALGRLERYALTDAFRPAALVVRSFMERETSARWSDETTIRDARVGLSRRTCTPFYRRALLEWCGRDRAQSSAIRPDSPAQLVQDLVNGSVAATDKPLLASLPPERVALYVASQLRKHGDYEGAIAALKPALANEFAPVRYEAAKRLADLHLKHGAIGHALRTVSRAYVENNRTANLFDAANLLSSAETLALQECYSIIGLAVVYDMYARVTGPDRDPQKADAAEEYAAALGATRPSAIKPSDGDHTAEELIYYLEYVCSPQTLDAFVSLDTTSDVEAERLAICQNLTDTNPLRASRYTAEITEITRNRVVKDRLRQVEQSKIYVDLPNIRKKASATIKDQFSRYQAMMESPEYSDEVLKLIKTVREYTGKRELTFQVLNAPSNPLETSFEQLVRDIFLLLVTSREHGLETYLSTRIRHGTLSGQLRSPLEVHKVITQKDETGSSYRRDQHWTSELELPDHVSQSLSALIEHFSARIDQTIDTLNKSWIQIRMPEHPEGMFDFRTFRGELYNLRADIDQETDFESFLDRVIDMFWKETENNLSRIRQRIDSEFRSDITLAFDDLHREATEQLPASGLTAFFSALTAARTDVQHAIDTVSGWFQITNRLEYPNYEFDIAVEVAAKSVASCYRHLPINLTKSLEVDRELRGETLSSVVDLLFILLENAVTKSHLGRGPSVSVRAIGEGNALLLEVENEVKAVNDPVAATQELHQRVAFSENSKTQQLVAREGGSGFPKIMRIVTHDLAMKHTMDARYSAKDKFRVDLSLHDGEIFA